MFKTIHQIKKTILLQFHILEKIQIFSYNNIYIYIYIYIYNNNSKLYR